MADQYIKSGTFDNILLVCSEVQSTTMDLSDRGRNTAVIFGDGAGAIVLSSTTEDRGILSTHLHSDGKNVKELWLKEQSTKSSNRLSKESIERGDHFLFMKRFPETINESLEFNGLTSEDIDLLVPHQANLRISDMIQKKMGLPDNKVFNNIQKYGNTTAASIPICLSEAKKEGRINNNDLVVCAAFGAGFLWGSTVIKW